MMTSTGDAEEEVCQTLDSEESGWNLDYDLNDGSSRHRQDLRD